MSTHQTHSQDRRPPATHPTVEITIGPGRTASIRPCLPGLIDLLAERRLMFVADEGPTGYRAEEAEDVCHKLGPGGTMTVDVGLLPRVLRILDDHDCPYRVDDRRERPPGLRPDESVLDAGNRRERGLIDALMGEPQGQIEVAGSRTAVETCVTICRAFPEAKIAIAVASKKQARRVWRNLTRKVCERVTIATTGTWIHRTRLLVGTFLRIPYWTVGQWDALLLPFAEEATGSAATFMISRMQFPRVYALVAPQRPIDRRTALQLEAIAGPVIVPLGRPRVAVRVVMLQAPKCAIALANNVTALERKRTLYWGNVARNAFIATVARAVADNDWSALEEFGIAERDVERTRTDGDRRVALLVESTEHAHALSTLLPGWSIRAAGQRKMSGTAFTGTSVVTPKIMTVAYAAKRRIRADVLIRATGTDSPLNLRGYPTLWTHQTRAALLLDFDDRQTRVAAQDTERRAEDYLRRDMDVYAVGVAQTNDGTIERNSSSCTGAPGDPEVGLARAPVQRSGPKRPIPSQSSGRR